MFYLVEASVGTPPQPQTFLLDTGSSDIWMFGPNVCENSDQESLDHRCAGGSFDRNKSSTFRTLNTGDFDIDYADDSEADGIYFTDTMSIGDASVSNLTMALANYTDMQFFGVMGVGYRALQDITEEDYYSSSSYSSEGIDGDKANGSTLSTPTLLDQMVIQGLIKTQAYSLYLDDLASSTGSILFGGVDHAKYTGDLITVPVQPEYNQHIELEIEWSSMGVTDNSGSILLGVNTSFPALALLDSGTPWMTVPEEVYDQLTDYFAVIEDDYWGALVNCSIIPASGTLDFGFGGSDGAVIAVPFSELALPLYSDETPLKFADGSPACSFAVQSNSGGYQRQHGSLHEPKQHKDKASNDRYSNDPDYLESFVLGAPFMRSAYLVFDMAHNQISLAQTNFDAGTATDIKEITSNDTASAIPGATKTATESFAPPTPTGSYAYSSYSDYYDSSTYSYSYSDYPYTTESWYSSYYSSYYSRHSSYYATVTGKAPAGGKVQYTTYNPTDFPSSTPTSRHSFISTGPLSVATAVGGSVSPHGGSYGSSAGSFSLYTSALGPVPTQRNATAVSGVRTTYTHSAVTALATRPGRAIATGTGAPGGTANAASATATGQGGGDKNESGLLGVPRLGSVLGAMSLVGMGMWLL